MKLWLLRPIKSGRGDYQGPWRPWYDKAFGFVMRAPSEHEARSMALGQCGDEGGKAWMDSTLSSCVPLSEEGHAMMIMRDFAAA